MLPDNFKEKYENFYNAASRKNHFDDKTTRMIQLASAMAAGCYP